jgi:hypothetical protein
VLIAFRHPVVPTSSVAPAWTSPTSTALEEKTGAAASTSGGSAANIRQSTQPPAAWGGLGRGTSAPPSAISCLSLALGPPICREVKSIADKVIALINLQEFDGNWSYPNNKVWEILGFESVADTDTGEDVWTTLIVIKFLEIKCAEEKDTWKFVVEKARGWLKGVTDLDRLERKAQEVVKNK